MFWLQSANYRLTAVALYIINSNCNGPPRKYVDMGSIELGAHYGHAHSARLFSCLVPAFLEANVCMLRHGYGHYRAIVMVADNEN